MYEWDEARVNPNQAKHSVDFATVEAFEWDDAVAIDDSRKKYDEARHLAFGPIDGCLHCMTFSLRGDRIYVISLRKANLREIERYGRKLTQPTRQDDARISIGIARDPDTFEASADDFARAKVAKEVLPASFYKTVKGRGQRGPQKSQKKVPISLRVDRDVLDAYIATGKGYQARMNEALRQAAKDL